MNIYFYLNFFSSIASMTIFLSFASSAENINAWVKRYEILLTYSCFFGITLGLNAAFLLKAPNASAETDALPSFFPLSLAVGRWSI